MKVFVLVTGLIAIVPTTSHDAVRLLFLDSAGHKASRATGQIAVDPTTATGVAGDLLVTGPSGSVDMAGSSDLPQLSDLAANTTVRADCLTGAMASCGLSGRVTLKGGWTIHAADLFATGAEFEFKRGFKEETVSAFLIPPSSTGKTHFKLDARTNLVTRRWASALYFEGVVANADDVKIDGTPIGAASLAECARFGESSCVILALWNGPNTPDAPDMREVDSHFGHLYGILSVSGDRWLPFSYLRDTAAELRWDSDWPASAQTGAGGPPGDRCKGAVLPGQ